MSDKLTAARLQLFKRLHEQVNDAKDRAINLYQAESNKVGLDRHNREWFDGDMDGFLAM